MSSNNDITEMINSIIQLAHIGICFYDLENFFSYLNTGERKYSGHYCDYCKAVKLLSGGQKACDGCDRIAAVKLAAEYGKPFFYRCHAGLCELILPIADNNAIKGIMFLGQCRIAGEELSGDALISIIQKGGNPLEFKRLYGLLPESDTSSLLACSKILQLYFEEKSSQNKLFKTSGINTFDLKLPMAERIKNYIDYHYKEKLSPKSICSLFYIGSSYLSRLFRKHYNITPTEYINKVRIDSAKMLLTSTDITISNIALNVGFQDPNYFYRVFEKQTHMRPSEYRSMKKTK